MKKLTLLLSLLALTFSLSSCYDEGHSLDNYYVATATFYETGSYYYIKTDDGHKLWPSASNITPNKHKDGDRIIVDFTILQNAPKDSLNYDYYVKVNMTNSILTKGIFTFSDKTSGAVKDSIGYDAVTIEDYWITNDYLNIQFIYGGGSKAHFINLVQDSTELVNSNGDFILELKHNKNKDLYNYKQWGIASFDISNLQIKDKDEISISLRARGNDNNLNYEKTFTYEYGEGAKNIEHKFSRTVDILDIK